MATQETPQPQNAVETMTPQQIADQIAAQQVGGEPPQLQREYVVQTSTGAVFRGKTQQELIDQMQKSIEHGSQKIKQQTDELEQARAQLQQQAPYVQQQQPQQPEAYSPQRYYELWAQDPNLAEDYRLQSTYGLTQAELARQIQESYEFTHQIRPEVTARAWMSTSDFPDGSDPEKLENAAQAFEKVWNEFYPGDYDMTPQKLEMVHSVALHRGLYEPQNRSTGQVTNPNGQPPQSQPQIAMPTLNTGISSSGGGMGSAGQDINRMSPEQIRQLIDQLPR